MSDPNIVNDQERDKIFEFIRDTYKVFNLKDYLHFLRNKATNIGASIIFINIELDALEKELDGPGRERIEKIRRFIGYITNSSKQVHKGL